MKKWSAEEIRRVGHRVVDLIADHLTSLRNEPAFTPVPPEIIEHYRMRVDALAAAIADDRVRGVRPIAVVATAGTTNTGAIDDVEGDRAALPAARHLAARRCRVRRAERIRTAPNLELVATGLSVVCFRYVPANAGADPRVRPGRVEDEQAIATLNRAILDRLQLGGDAFITSTELRGSFVLRACIVNYRSTRDDIDRLIAAVLKIGAAVSQSEI